METLFWENYPANYDHVDFETQMRILALFKLNKFPGVAEREMFRDMYRADEIYVEYDWVGHRGEWFLATAYDAQMQEDYLASCD